MKRLVPLVVAVAGLVVLSGPSADPARAEGAETPALGIPNERSQSGVVAGGQPTPEQLERAAKAGVRTVVNLRAVGEPGSIANEKQLVEDLGMRYVAIPIAGSEDLSPAKACRLAEVLDAAGSRPVLLHCASGNRVGALLALEAFHVDGVDAAAALERGRAMGLTSLDGAVRQRLATRLAAACATP